MVKKSNATQNIIISVLIAMFITIIFKFIQISTVPSLVGNKDFITILLSISFALILYIFMTSSAFCIYKNKDDQNNKSYVFYLLGFGLIILATIIIFYIQKYSIGYLGAKISENMGELQQMGGSEESMMELQKRYQYIYAIAMYIFMLIPLTVNIFISYFTTRFIVKTRINFLQEKFNLYLSVLISVVVTFLLLFLLTYLLTNLTIPISNLISQIIISVIMFVVYLSVTFFEINASFTETIASFESKVSKDETLQDDVSKNETLQDDVSKDDTLQDDVSKDDILQDDVSKDDILQDDIKDPKLDFKNENLFEK